MTLNRAYIGRTWQSPEVYEVSREKLRDYAVAIGEPHPAYLDPAVAAGLGHPDVVAPVTFVAALWARMNTWPLREPDIGRSKEPNMVIGEQHLVSYRPIWPGDRLMFSATVKDIRDIGGKHELMEMELLLTTLDGERVAAIRELAISRGTAAGKEG
jgi:acyl dehydratase